MDRQKIEERMGSILDAFEGSSAVERIMELFDGAVYVPGQFKCAICDFHGTYKAISMEAGSVGANKDPLPRVCPNKCGMLERVTWKEWSEGQSKGTDRIIAREHALKVPVKDLMDAVRLLLAGPLDLRATGMVRAAIKRVEESMGAELSDELVRIVYEYWQHLFDGAEPKDLKVVEGK